MSKINEQLAEGAEAIRKAEQETKKNKRAKSVESKKGKKDVSPTAPESGAELEVLPPPIKECKDPVDEILQRRVSFNKDYTAVKLDKETTPGEYVRLFDYFAHNAAYSNLLLGDVINAAETVFGEKYAAAMAATGRSMDAMKKIAYVARNTPPSVRAIVQGHENEIGYTHLEKMAKIPQLEDKKAVAEELVEKAKAGKPLSTAEVAAWAEKFAPKKKKAKKPKDPAAPEYVMSDDEQRRFSELTNSAEMTAALCRDKELKFVGKLTAAETKELRKNLTAITAFLGLIEPA